MRVPATPIRWISPNRMMAGLYASSAGTPADVNLASVSSPGRVLSASVQLSPDGRPSYEVRRKGKQLIGPSRLGIILANAAALDAGFSLAACTVTQHDDTWEQPWGERRYVRNHYKQLRVELVQRAHGGRRLVLVLRVFDDGIGIRYELPSQPRLPEVKIADELTEFAIVPAAAAWWQPTSEFPALAQPVRKTALHEVGMANTPLTLRTGDGIHLSVHEAALVDYAPLSMRRVHGQTLRALLAPGAPKAAGSGAFATPWRTVQVADDAAGLSMSDLILNLNEPNRLGDVSWARPARVVRTDMASARRRVDLAATHGIDGVLVKASGADLPALAAHARGRGVRLVGHHEAGVGPGDPRERVRHCLAAVIDAARDGFALATHAAIKDTGLRRTYPNWFPLAVDHTRAIPCGDGKDGRPGATRARQLANLVVTYSPLVAAADLVCGDANYPGPFGFIRQVPADWADTRAINGEVGEYATVARKDRHSDDWYVGALTDGLARALALPLSFLDAGRSYLAEIYRDGDLAGTRNAQRANLVIERVLVNADDTLPLVLAPNGGQALRLSPATAP